MKKIYIIIISVFLVNCDTDVEGNWVALIDKEVLRYDNSAFLLKREVILEHDSVEVFVFKKDSKNLQKISLSSKISGDFPINMDYYIKNKNIIKVTMKGLSPIIYKRIRKENEPCCSILEASYFFDKETKGFLRKKSIDILNIEEYSTEKEYLKDVAIEEQILKTSQNNYDNFLNSINRIKGKLSK